MALLPATRPAWWDYLLVNISIFIIPASIDRRLFAFLWGWRDPVWDALQERPYRQQIGGRGTEEVI